MFRLDLAHGIHGVPHWSRVWYHGRTIAVARDLDPAVNAWFAFLHDSHRHDDGYDPGHGAGAADFAIRLRGDGLVSELSRAQFEHLCEAMKLHSDGHTTGEPAILACWDADRLDLRRAGIRPEPRRLCTSTARQARVIDNAARMALGRRHRP